MTVKRMGADYMLEVEIDGETASVIACPHVTRYAPEIPFPFFVEHTLRSYSDGDAFPVVQATELRELHIRIQGESGLGERPGRDRNGAPTFRDGPELFREFVRFLRDFTQVAADAHHTGRDVRLIFRAVDDDLDHYVVPVSISPLRDEDRYSFQYGYTLQLRGIAPAGAAPVGPFGRAEEAAKALDDAVASAGSWLLVAEEYRAQGQAVSAAYRAPIDSLIAQARKVSELSTSTPNPRDIMLRAMQDLAVVADAGLASVRDGYDRMPLADRERSAELFQSVSSGMGQVRKAAIVALGMARIPLDESAYTSAGVAASVSRVETAYSALQAGEAVGTWTVLAGDDWRSIAARATGSADRWRDVAALNGYARSPESAPPLAPGTTVRVPVLSPRRTTRPEGAGVDWLLRDGDYVLAGEADAVTVSGPQNLAQAVMLRGMTAQGEAPGLPGYGIAQGIQTEQLGAQDVGLLASRARTQYLRDTRIASVQSIEVVIDGDTVDLAMTIVPVEGGDSTRLRVPLR